MREYISYITALSLAMVPWMSLNYAFVNRYIYAQAITIVNSIYRA